ncbi:MAG: hypothetical protein J7496_17315 [Novosphingobium sp.]|nr:hypothetical protein [Novosphingobium sp.]MBO9604261.1 hypothetical protein [Novosphingobium sp.]
MTPELFAWSHATFAFAIDGKYDMMSLNPLEMTNFEMCGTIAGVAGLIITFIRSRSKAKRQLPHSFTAQETEEDKIL